MVSDHNLNFWRESISLRTRCEFSIFFCWDSSFSYRTVNFEASSRRADLPNGSNLLGLTLRHNSLRIKLFFMTSWLFLPSHRGYDHFQPTPKTGVGVNWRGLCPRSQKDGVFWCLSSFSKVLWWLLAQIEKKLKLGKRHTIFHVSAPCHGALIGYLTSAR